MNLTSKRFISIAGLITVFALFLSACSSSGSSGSAIKNTGAPTTSGSLTTVTSPHSPSGLPSLAELSNLTNYSYQFLTNGQTFIVNVYSPTVGEDFAPFNQIYIGDTVYQKLGSSWYKVHNSSSNVESMTGQEATMAKSFLDQFNIAGITVQKSTCSEAGQAGTQYMLTTSANAKSILKEVFTACVSNKQKVLLSYEMNASGSAASIPGQNSSSVTLKYVVTGINNVARIGVPSPIATP